ncbi:MerR family transcriptional regulator [Paractinoplanes abujensis]|uniref:DNA-binding transcriptional MerR regulator n=1 Tax=Paractinoplanes abujensis TaxID=882441 RepID=A0A7W7CSF4_9ACTN|nr:MerR family transcriptional regulator [Actinoplanes abujensis]MBB4692106.1 DNA-binding transcriptional MerR regulator [Actinoplanes abujensis]GID16479.1 MerR family transcriptional regulator [Actinoplanes abujensis]
MEEHLSVGQVAELAGVTVRTLHHYDEIGLLRPSARTSAGHRAYAAGDVERLREVLAYRRLGFGLQEIAGLVGNPAIDAVAHLRRLRGLLADQRDRAAAMVKALDHELAARTRGIATTPEEQLRMLYDTIGSAYPATRRTEPRIAARIWSALGDARTVLNVGAGTGSYEPADRDVTAVEPSAVMRAQRPPGAAPCVSAAAERLPFADQSFDAAMAVSTVHHWRDPIAGLREMRRVARRVVVLTYEASTSRFWLTRDYLPEFEQLAAALPPLADLTGAIGGQAEPVLIPWDCADGFFEAYWRRPQAYLDSSVRRAVSVWTRVGPEAERRAVEALRDDLASGRWAGRNRDVAALDTAELGLRLLVA